MNIFNKAIRTEEQKEHTFMNLGDLQIKQDWLAQHPQYHSMVLTCIHMANLLSGIQYLQSDTNEKNLFKMAEMNKQVNQIVQGKKIFERKFRQVRQSEQPEIEWDLTIQKVAGLFNTCYTRDCHIKSYRLEIQSKVKKEPVVEDLRGYDMKLEFKMVDTTTTNKKNLTKEQQEKQNFKWLEGYPVRVFLKAEGKRFYAIYIPKVTKAKEFMDYFQTKKSSSGFGKHKEMISRHAIYFKKNVTAAFAQRIEMNANRVFRNPREIFIQENIVNQNEHITSQSPQTPSINKQESRETDSPVRKLSRGRALKLNVIRKQSHEENSSGDEPLSAIVRRRQVSYVDPSDIIRKSPLPKKYIPVSDTIEQIKLDQETEKEQSDQVTPSQIIRFGQPSHPTQPNQSNNLQIHEVEFESQQKPKEDQRQVEARLARSSRLDIRLQVRQIYLYVKHFEKKIQFELIQCKKSDIETHDTNNVKYPMISYDIELEQSFDNPLLFRPTMPHELRISSDSNDFKCRFKFPTGTVQVEFELDTRTKYQKYFYRLMHIKSVPFAGRLGLMLSRTQMKPYNDLTTVEFMREFLRTQNYDTKYLFIDKGKERLSVDDQFKEKVWTMLLDNNNEELIEKQVFLGIPEKLRNSFFNMLTQGKNIPLTSLTKLDFHELRLAKEALQSNIIEELQQFIIVEDLIDKLLRFECNRSLRDRMYGVLIYTRYKYGESKNILYIVLYEIFRKLERVLLESAKSKQATIKIFELYFETEYELDEFFSDVYNYL